MSLNSHWVVLGRQKRERNNFQVEIRETQGDQTSNNYSNCLDARNLIPTRANGAI